MKYNSMQSKHKQKIVNKADESLTDWHGPQGCGGWETFTSYDFLKCRVLLKFSEIHYDSLIKNLIQVGFDCWSTVDTMLRIATNELMLYSWIRMLRMETNFRVGLKRANVIFMDIPRLDLIVDPIWIRMLRIGTNVIVEFK